jgi:hypothetical protein
MNWTSYALPQDKGSPYSRGEQHCTSTFIPDLLSPGRTSRTHLRVRSKPALGPSVPKVQNLTMKTTKPVEKLLADPPLFALITSPEKKARG